ncbi:type II toxin-antitoxin system PemK/MazF family toxin [Thiotrichales bacterium 19X7-9]|nr:type II toxin-antitoxin system PemK/MazF family toxin [Thiotrichales bacterium 19X7-9]
MKEYIPSQGDIIWLDFHPSSGSEIIKRRPAVVLSKTIFNEHTGFAIVVPITSTKRDNQFEVGLPKKCKTQGNILTYQVKSVDYKSRNAKKIEVCPQTCVAQILQITQLIIS